MEDDIEYIMRQANKNLEDLDIPSVVRLIIINNNNNFQHKLHDFVLFSEVKYGLREKIKLLIDR